MTSPKIPDVQWTRTVETETDGEACESLTVFYEAGIGWSVECELFTVGSVLAYELRGPFPSSMIALLMGGNLMFN